MAQRGRKPKTTKLKFCAFCGAVLERKRYPGGRIEDFRIFKMRKYCDRECMLANHRKRNEAKVAAKKAAAGRS